MIADARRRRARRRSGGPRPWRRRRCRASARRGSAPLGCAFSHLREHRLLLVAARELLDRRVERRRADRRAARGTRSAVARSADASSRPQPRHVVAQRRQRDVRRDRLRQREPELPAVLGEVGDAVRAAPARGERIDERACRRSSIAPASAGAMPNSASATSVRPAPTRPAKPSTSPRAQLEARRPRRRRSRAEPVDAQARRRPAAAGVRDEEVRHLAPDHVADRASAGVTSRARPRRDAGGRRGAR